MTKQNVEKYLKELTHGTSFWFDVRLINNETEIWLKIHGDNPENEDWQWSFPIKNSDDKKDLLDAIKKEIQSELIDFDIDENVYRVLEEKRNECQYVDTVDLIANEQYKENALRKFYQKLENGKDKVELKNPESKKIAKMLFKEVIQLNENLMNNESSNLNASPDAVLHQIMRDQTDFTYSLNELFEIYKKTVDEEAFEQMFKLFTGITFYEYLKKCKEALNKQDIELVL